MTLIFTAIRPSEDTKAVHLVVVPVAKELSAVLPYVLALAVDVVLMEITGVGVSIIPLEEPLAVLEAILIFTNV